MDLSALDDRLGSLRRNAHDEATATSVEELEGPASASLFPEWIRRIELARARHEGRREFRAVAALLLAEVRALTDDPALQFTLLRELARVRQEELLDTVGAIAAMNEALAVQADEELQAERDHLVHVRERWKDVQKRFADEAANASDGRLQASLYARAAALTWQFRKKGRDNAALELFERALHADPGAPQTCRAMAVVYRRRSKWSELGALAVECADRAKSPEERAGWLAQAVDAYGHVEAPPVSLQALCRTLNQLDPSDERAIQSEVERLTREEDWGALVELYERALRSPQASESERGTLLQLAMVHWRIRGDVAAAEPYFARLRRLEPSHPSVVEFYRGAFFERGEERERYLAALLDAVRGESDPARRLELSVDLAEATQDVHGAGDRVVELWKAVIRLDPGNAKARTALREIFRATGKWNALVDMLRQDLDALPAEDVAGRLAILEQMVPIYRDELRLDAMLLSTYRAILALDANHVGAYEALVALSEETGRYNDVIELLRAKLAVVTEADERVALLERIASLWVERFSNFAEATRPLEAILELDPNHRFALVELKRIYERNRDWARLYSVVAREMALSSDPEARLQSQMTLAELAAEKLQRPAEAIQHWHAVVEERPDTPSAIDRLTRLAAVQHDWAELAYALERDIERESDARVRAQKLRRLGGVYRDELRDLNAAQRVFEELLRTDPGNSRAVRVLRDVHASRGDWDALEATLREANDLEGLVEALGAAAEHATDRATKIDLSLRAARVYEEEIRQPARAVRSYERILTAAPEHLGAAEALARIYETEENWARLAQVRAVLLHHRRDADPAERAAEAERLSDLFWERLGDARRAFEWLLGAYELTPANARIVEKLEATAGMAEEMPRYIEALEQSLPRLGEEDRVRTYRRLARLRSDELEDAKGATEALLAAWQLEPNDDALFEELRAHYRAASAWGELRTLLERAIEARGGEASRALRLELAILAEERLGDRAAAATAYETLLASQPEDDSSLAALERLYRADNRWADVARTLERRIDVADAALRSDLLLRVGSVFREKLNDQDAALDAFQRMLDESGGDERGIEAIEALAKASPSLAPRAETVLERAYEARASHANLREVLERRVRHAESEDERGQLEVKLLSLVADELGDLDAAFDIARNVVLARPGDMRFWDRVEELGRRRSTVEDVVALYERAVSAKGGAPERVLALCRRAVRFADQELRDRARTENLRLRIWTLDPDDREAFDALKEIYADSGRWRDLQALYRTRFDRETTPERKIDVLLESAFVHEEVLEDVAHSIESYEGVLRLDANHVAARAALERLYRKAQRWRDLASLLEREIEGASAPDRIRIAFELAEVHRRRLNAPDQALALLEKVLELDPDHERARESVALYLDDRDRRGRAAEVLAPIYERREDWAEYAMALRVLLDTDAGSDAERKTSRLHRLLHVLEHKLRDLPAAFQVAVTLVERNAADGVARDALARIARARGAEVEQGEVLERVAAKVEDPALRRELLVTLAELWDNHVQDSGRAESAYRALLPLLEGDGAGRLRVARAIARLITSRPERVRHDGQTLRAMVELEVELENERPKRRAALLRLAKLRESVDDDVRAAMNALDEARALGDSDPALRRELIRLAEKAGDPARLAAELAELEMEAETPAERRDALLRRVTVLESTGASPGVLRDALEAHLRREKPSVDVADRLLAVAAQGDDWDARVDALTARIGVEPDAVRAGEFAFQRAEIERKELRRYLDAVRSYRAVLDAVPDHPGVLEALLAIAESASTDAAQAAAVLAVPGLERGKRYPELVRALDVAGRAGEGRVDALLRSAEVLVTELRDPPGALERIALAMDAAPDDALRKLLDVADAYARELPSGAIAPLARRVAERAPDPESRRLARMRAAESYLASGGNDEAEDLLEQMLEDEPGNLAALDLLLRMYESTGANEKLFDALRRKAELVTSPQERIELLVRAADLAEGALSDPDAAIELYEELRSKGDPKLATARLERLYERSERWGDAAELLEEELERGRVDAAEANYRLGELARVRFEDMDRALRHFRAAFQRRRDHAPTAAALEEMLSDPAVRAEAAELLEPYFMQRLAWDKVTRVLDVRIAAAASNDERRKLALRRARIAEEYLEDLDGAFDAYASMLGDDPTDSAVRDALERLGRVLSRERGVADVYFRVVDQAISDTPATVDMARVAASRYRAAEAEPERVARLLERVIAFDPTDNEAVEWLDAAYAALGAIDRRLELARERADRAGSDAAAADVLHARAELLWKAERPVEEVLEAYVEILDLVPADERALDALDGLLRAEGRWDDLVEHLERRLDLVIGTPAEVEILFSIAKVLHAELARSQDAIGVLRSVVERNPRHAATIQLLEELVTGEDFRSEVVEILAPVYRGTNQWKKLVAVLESDLVVLDDLDARAVRLAEIAELHERRGRNPALALDAWARLFAEHPDRDEVREQVERLGIATGQWDALVRAYEHAAERSTDATVIGELLAAIARVHDQERGDPRLAIDAYERLWTHDPSNLFVLDELDSLQTLLSDWESVDDVIGRKIETETEPEPRGELLRRRGVLRRDQLGDAARAVEAFEAAVAEEPDDLESWRALDGLFESAEQFERRDLALERRYELEDPPARFEIGVLRAALLVDRLGRPDDAVDVLRRVVEDEPRFMPARAALATLFEREGRHAELANALEDTARVVEDAHEAAGYLHRAAETTEQHLELPSLAIERYTAALDLAPEFAPSLDALVRMSHRAETRAEASHLALPRLEALGRWDDAVEILEELVTDAEDVISRHALLLRIARTEETVRDDAERAFAALERAFEARPDDAFTADELARVGELLDVWPRVVAAFEKAAKALEPAVPSGILYQRAAEFAERRLGDPARAVQALVAADAIEHDPPHVLAELDRLYLALGDARALDGVLVRRLELAAEDAERVGFYVRLGAIRRDALEDVDGSIDAYREALETEPSNASARGALEAMLGDGERIGVVSAALEAAYISLGDEAARAELESRRAEHADNRMEAAHHWELAAGHWRTVGDANRAFEAHRAAFVCAPEPPERLEHLDAAVAASGAWERLAGAAEEAVAQADVPDADRVRVLVHAAGWYAGSLGSMDAALECLGRALAVDASASTAHAAKSDLLHMTRRYEEELDALDAWLMHVREEAERLRLLRRAAKVAAGLVHDATRASAANEAILAIEADDVEAMDALAEQYVSLGRMRDLEGLLLRRAEVTDDPVLRASLHSRRGSVLESVLDQPEEAVGAYERVLDDAPSDPVAFDALERLYPTLGQYEAWANLLGRRIDGLEGVARIAPLIERAKIRRTLLHDLVGARADVDAAFDIEPHSSMAFDELEAIHLSEEAWEAVVALLERRADAAQSRGDRGGEILFLERAAETARDHGFNASAEAAYVRLLDLAPDHQAAVRGLVWLAEKKGDDVALRDALERLVRMESDAPRAEAAMRLAELEDRCGTPEDARRAVQVAFETSPTNEDIASNLRKRLTEANDFRGIVHMLVLRAEHDPENATAYLLEGGEIAQDVLHDAVLATEVYERARRFDPENRELLNALGAAYIVAGRSGDAIAVFESVIASYGGKRLKEMGLAYHRLGTALAASGDDTRALQAFENGFKYDLTSIPVLRDLGKLAYERGEDERAQKALRALLLQRLDERSQITKADVYFMLADIAARQGEGPKALSMAQRALAEDRGHAAAQELVGRLKSAAG